MIEPLVCLEVTETDLVVQVHLDAQTVNFHRPEFWRGDVELRAGAATPPCGDLCLEWRGTGAALQALLDGAGVHVVEGPTERRGGRRMAGSSIYVRDPDGNLVEFIRYPGQDGGVDDGDTSSGMTAPESRPHGSTVADKSAITALIHSYAFLVDDGDIDAVTALFEHATWRSDRQAAVRRGAAEVRPVYEQLLASNGAARTRHRLTDVAVTVDPGATTASSRCHWTVLRDGTDGSTDVVLSGQYVDRFARVGDGWRFADRLITTDLIGG